MNHYDKPDRIDMEAEHSRLAYRWSGPVVTAPAGECPFHLNDISEAGVHHWAEKVIRAGHENDIHYAPSALRRFARYFYDFDSDEYLQICEYIQSCISGSSIGDVKEREVELVKPPKQEPEVEDWLQPVVRKPSLGKIGRGLQKGEGTIELGGSYDE